MGEGPASGSELSRVNRIRSDSKASDKFPSVPWYPRTERAHGHALSQWSRQRGVRNYFTRFKHVANVVTENAAGATGSTMCSHGGFVKP